MVLASEGEVEVDVPGAVTGLGEDRLEAALGAAIDYALSFGHLPIIIDPSHGTGVWSFVPPMTKAGLAAGADGAIIEVHPNPAEALSDGAQSLKPKVFEKLMGELEPLAGALGRTLVGRSKAAHLQA